MNFWNFTDPITEFYGLDEYTWFELAPPLDPAHIRTRTSPTNIRSRSSLKNHGEYWSNIEQIQTPFAKRVLGEPKPKEWAPEPIQPKYWHHRGVLLLWLLLVAGISLGGFWLVTSGLLNILFDYYTAIQDSVQGILATYKMLFLPEAGDVPNLLQKIIDLATSQPMKSLWRLILNGSLIILVIVAVLDWLNQIVRAISLRLE